MQGVSVCVFGSKGKVVAMGAGLHKKEEKFLSPSSVYASWIGWRADGRGCSIPSS